MNQPSYPFARSARISLLLVCCTLLGLAGTDLVLPAIPQLPDELGGSVTLAQMVLAAFTGGTCIGLILYGELGACFDHGKLLLVSMLAYAALSLVAALSFSLEVLVFVRFFQGMAASCAAVIAPGMIRKIFSEQHAVRALGILGSVESLAPAIAPIIGVLLLSLGGWQLSFELTGILALLLAFFVWKINSQMPTMHMTTVKTELHQLHLGYVKLLKNTNYLTQALSHAALIGGLLVFVFGSPVVMVITMNGEISDFIIMQVCGITSFIVCMNLSSQLVQRYGSFKTIWAGSLLSFLGAILLTLYALSGGRQPWMVWLLFVPFNMGLGFRGPPAFYQALVATGGDDARGSAMLILLVLLCASLGTAAIAPWLDYGLVALGLASVGICLFSLVFLWINRGYREAEITNTSIDAG